jgi:prepilin-type N-terminal cleavage/methylation domain-containing protein
MYARMSTKAKAPRRGFTLLELLVVTGIIGILLAILMPAITSAFKKAVIGKARTEMAGIAAAIKAYYAEYGVMPTPTSNGQPDKTFMGKWGTGTNPLQSLLVFDILRGINTTNNPKRIVFLDVPVNSMQGTSTISNHVDTYTANEGYYLDPWKNPYMIVMDTDFNGQIDGFYSMVGAGYSAIANDLFMKSPYTNGVYPGTIVGVMSYGPKPGYVESFLKSW